ncbi:MAG: hypothetical protein NZ992_02960 [Candidatus Korarchaeum sp.]|nr:hypothetical protein [Candidatus Korarchaeum sp.]
MRKITEDITQRTISNMTRNARGSRGFLMEMMRDKAKAEINGTADIKMFLTT